MTAKEYLKQIRFLEIEIRDKRDELIILNARAESCTSPELTGMPSGSGASDKLGNIVAKIVDLEGVIRQQIIKLNEQTYKITAQIELIQDRRERSLLIKRYIMHKDWLTIADELDCSVQRCYQIHGEALKSFTQLMK